MIGTDPETRGGISAVIGTYRRAGFFAEWPVIYISSHSDGGRIVKLKTAAKALAEFVGLLVQRRIAIVHVHSASDASFWRKTLFIVLARLARRPVIFHLHGGGFVEFYDRLGSIRKAVVRKIIEGAAYVVVLSESWGERMTRIAPNAKVVVIHNPVEESPEQSSAPDGHGQPKPIIFVGRIVPEKGVFDLLEALAAVHEELPALELVLAGDGDTAAVLVRASELRLSGAVHCIGWIRGEQKQRLFEGAMALVLPSHVEGLPMVLLEAMAAGLPVIATRVGAIPEVIASDREGLLIEPRDIRALAEAIRKIATSPDLCHRYGTAGRETVRQRFGVRVVLARLAGLYRSLGISRRASG